MTYNVGAYEAIALVCLFVCLFVSHKVRPPIMVESIIERHSHSRVEYLVKVGVGLVWTTHEHTMHPQTMSHSDVLLLPSSPTHFLSPLLPSSLPLLLFPPILSPPLLSPSSPSPPTPLPPLPSPLPPLPLLSLLSPPLLPSLPLPFSLSSLPSSPPPPFVSSSPPVYGYRQRVSSNGLQLPAMWRSQYLCQQMRTRQSSG